MQQTDQMERTENNGQGKMMEVYNPNKIPLWYSLMAPVAVLLMSIVIGYVCLYMLTNPNIVTKAMGVLSIALFIGYIGYYYFLFFSSRKDITQKAVLTSEYIEHHTKSGVKRFNLCDVVFTMSYSSSTNLCIIIATNDDYMVLICSCSYLFTRDGKGVLTPFYAINKFFMDTNERHINFVKNKKYRKKNPFVIPQFLFEIEFYSKRAAGFVSKKRESFRVKSIISEEAI